MGPDPEKGELRGYACGIIAIGDFATGVLALGGIVQRVIAIGRLALGLLFSMDGLSTGLLASGRLARGGIAAGGGAIGGVACGYSAVGSGAVGTHVIDSMRQDLEAVRFFNEWLLFPQNALNRRLGG